MGEDEKEDVDVKEENTEETPQSEEEQVLTDKELAEQYLASWQRAQADFINFKKRADQEKAEFAKFANGNIMTGILAVIDDFERALENVPDEVSASGWVEGIEHIYRKLLAELESRGLATIEAQGADFDPNFHQAVLYEEGDEGKVIEELQKGYMLHDRLLRPTMVKVGKGQAEESAINESGK